MFLVVYAYILPFAFFCWVLCFCQICRFLFFFLHKPFQKQNNSTQQHNLNKDDTNDKINTNDKLCNCRKEPCPLNNQCLISNIIYKATITTDKTTKQYLGSTGNSFKQRYRNHKSSFNNINKRHTTELSNYIWNLKDNKTDFKIKWEILNRTRSKFNTKYGCKLCNLEKIEIDKSDKNITLNKKSKRQNICIHYQKHFYSKI